MSELVEMILCQRSSIS